MGFLKIITYCLSFGGAIWFASEWWQTGLAQPLDDPVLSPNGCYRVVELKPFWVLPDMFHRKSHPDEDRPPTWFPRWGLPGFYRLYDQRTGEFLGQSKIYDLENASGPIRWGHTGNPVVKAGFISIGPNVPDCIGDRPSKAKVNQ
ncbi:hypothetical protein ACIP1T_22930 [Pseudomonas japonica]|uniref:hypothetical protein n=1 Tax=Pseudomonas japonica TaxID=256466 RepID=UPI0038099800